AFGAALMSDYNFRGISQSNRRPAANAYIESRFNATPTLQFYGTVTGNSIDFPNHAAAEIDFNAGVRPTFGPLAMDLGAQYYWYPGGTTFNGLGGPGSCTNGVAGVFCNTLKGDLS